ncbi:hypothetical protein TNCV_4401951 [Trichonephila clavipes]|nr:hypothetical protein TNCV_4401951 [Trichonephila clavipes]
MAYLGKGRREDLFVLATELNLEFDKSMTIATLKDLIIAEKLEEFEDFKKTLKQKSSSPFVKKQEFKSTEKNRRYEAPGKFEYNRKDKKFPASTNYNKHYEAPVIKYESVQRYQDSAQKGYYNKNYNASKHAPDKLFKITEIQKHLQKKLARSSLRKVYVLKRYFLER